FPEPVLTAPAPPPLLTAPTPPPATTAEAADPGSGVPLDAPGAATPPAPSPPPALSRGDGTPSDKALADGDAAFANGDFAVAEKAYKKAAGLAPKDPAPIVGHVRARAAKANVPTDYNAAPRDPVLLAAVRDLGRAIKLDASYAPAHLELGRALLVLGRA